MFATMFYHYSLLVAMQFSIDLYVRQGLCCISLAGKTAYPAKVLCIFPLFLMHFFLLYVIIIGLSPAQILIIAVTSFLSFPFYLFPKASLLVCLKRRSQCFAQNGTVLHLHLTV